ncbi:hypothetical protein HG530_015002 [Fusarium avenaceum]|nr:hypothetical protein HG530_015002 [Fusarium avenaceum]
MNQESTIRKSRSNLLCLAKRSNGIKGTIDNESWELGLDIVEFVRIKALSSLELPGTTCDIISSNCVSERALGKMLVVKRTKILGFLCTELSLGASNPLERIGAKVPVRSFLYVDAEGLLVVSGKRIGEDLHDCRNGVACVGELLRRQTLRKILHVLELLEQRSRCISQVLNGSLTSGVVGELTSLCAKLNTFSKKMHQGLLGISRASSTSGLEIRISHTVGDTPVPQLAVLLEGIDNLDHVSGSECCAEETTVLLLSFITGFSDSLHPRPPFVLDVFPEICLRKVLLATTSKLSRG